MTFRVGMKVACVDVSGDAKYFLNLNATYEITSINWPFLRVNCRPDGFSGGEADCGYHHTRFRPIVERKTSIEIFKRMLVPSRQKETAQ